MLSSVGDVLQFVQKLHGRPNNKERCPGMWIWPNQTAFHFRLSTNDYWNDGLDLDSGKIPFQRYVHVCYTVNGRKIKAYVNGILEKEKTLSSPMKMISDETELFIGLIRKGFVCQLECSQFQYHKNLLKMF